MDSYDSFNLNNEQTVDQNFSKKVNNTRIENILELRKLRQEINHAIGNLNTVVSEVQKEEIDEFFYQTIFERGNPNSKIAFKPQKVRTQSKKVYAIGAALFVMAAGVSLSPKIQNMVENISTTIEENNLINEEVLNFSKNSVVPNTKHSYTIDAHDTPVATHSHNYIETFMDAKNLCDDPIVALYLAKEAMGSDCINKGMSTFNLMYGTDYKNIADFLIKNNLENEANWKRYVGSKLAAEREESLYGESIARR